MERIKECAEKLATVLEQLNPGSHFIVVPIVSLGTVKIVGNVQGDNIIRPANVEFNSKWGFNNGLSRGTLDYRHIDYEYNPGAFPKPRTKIFHW